MKHIGPVFLLTALFSIGFVSCKKINEATELGGDLIPAVDNVTTFETILETETFNREWLNDSSTAGMFDRLAVGHISSDPEFGMTQANSYFSIGRTTYGTYPFAVKRDSIKSIDSVILSLDYKGFYGDSNSTLSFTVYEIDPSSGFNDTTFYKYTAEDFSVTSQLGNRSFAVKDLNDSIAVYTPGDTNVVRTANVLRIKLDNTLGDRLKNFDTATVYKNDSAFKQAFRGIAVKADNSGNALTYFDLTTTAKSKLVVYYKGQINGKDSALSTEFYHLPIAGLRNGQANIIKRTPQGNWASAITKPAENSSQLYIQSTPGSFAYIRVPGLDTLKNKVVHLAELIATRLPSAGDETFGPPSYLFLDRINKTNDTAFLFENDVLLTQSGYSIEDFGGSLKGNTYRFNVSRYVQNLITRRQVNDTLRLYAPFRTILFDKNLGSKQSVTIAENIAYGRVVLAGGNYPNPSQRLRLRIVYSNL